MKRLLAAVVALACIAGGFVVFNRRTDPERGKQPLRLWCVNDVAEACRSLANTRLQVSVGSPLDIDSKNPDTRFDAVVTSPAWLDRLDDQSQLKIQAPLVSSPLVVASRQGETVCAQSKCLADEATRIAFPSAKTLTAALFAATVFDSKPAEELPSGLADYLSGGGAGTAGFDALAALNSARVIDGALLLEATAKGTAVQVQPVEPAAVLQLAIGHLTVDDRIDTLAEQLRTTLESQGWRPSTANAPGPSGDATVSAFTVLNP